MADTNTENRGSGKPESNPGEGKGAAKPGAGAAQPRAGDGGDGAGQERRSFQAAGREAEESLRAAQDAAKKTADAGAESLRANGEILRQNMEVAEDLARTAVEVGMTSVEGFTRTMSRAMGVARPDGEMADQFAQNLRAISEASPALSRVAQEASRAWLGVVKQTVRNNLEALGEMSRCRTAPDLVALQTRLLRDNLQLAVEAGQNVIDASTQAIAEAGRAVRSGREGRGPQAR